MGKLLSVKWVTKEEDLSQVKTGPFSIITWRNRKPSSEAEPKEPRELKAEK